MENIRGPCVLDERISLHKSELKDVHCLWSGAAKFYGDARTAFRERESSSDVEFEVSSFVAD